VFKGYSLIRRAAVAVAAAGMLLSMFTQGYAMGGGASDKEAPPDNTKRLKLMPIEEGTNMYGWIRLTPDNLSLGANRVKPDTFYTVYFVNGNEKQAAGKDPTVRSSGSGEIKFNLRLTEPLGARWTKLVLYQHTDNKQAPTDATTKPFMEGSLR
jgi:hypothetical protein